MVSAGSSSDRGWPSAFPVFDSPEHLMLAFFIVWTGIALLARFLFGRGRKAAWKRSAWPPFYVASNLIFVGFVWALGFPPFVVGLAFVSGAAITIYGLKMVWFCEQCGGRSLDRLGEARPTTCGRCGAKREGASH
jgi:hypothetical protein